MFDFHAIVMYSVCNSANCYRLDDGEEEEEDRMETEAGKKDGEGEEDKIQEDEEADQVLKEAYAEAERERKAMAQRAEQPLEERQAEFKKMLLERGVSGGGGGSGGKAVLYSRSGRGGGKHKLESNRCSACCAGVSILYMGEGAAKVCV